MTVPSISSSSPTLSVGLLIAISLLANISMDIHLPLAPMMMAELQTTAFAIQLLFIISVLLTTVTPLFWGGLSDCYGRRTLLIPSCMLMTIGQFGSAGSPTIEALLVARTLQYIGVGAVLTVALAVICDMYEGQTRARAIALLEISIPIGVLIAPLIGAFTAKNFGWRYNFFILGILQTVLLIILIKKMPETLKERTTYSWEESQHSIQRILTYLPFLKPVLLLSLVNAPYMVFITHASFLYIEKFGLTEIQFALHQSLIAFTYFLGLLIYRRLAKHYSIPFLLHLNMGGYLLYGMLALAFSREVIPLTPLTITASTLVSSFVSGSILTSCSSLALANSTNHLGTRSALIEFIMGSIGSFFMILSGCLNHSTQSVYTIIAVSVGLSFLVWQRMYHRNNQPIST